MIVILLCTAAALFALTPAMFVWWASAYANVREREDGWQR